MWHKLQLLVGWVHSLIIVNVRAGFLHRDVWPHELKIWLAVTWDGSALNSTILLTTITINLPLCLLWFWILNSELAAAGFVLFFGPINMMMKCLLHFIYSLYILCIYQLSKMLQSFFCSSIFVLCNSGSHRVPFMEGISSLTQDSMNRVAVWDQKELQLQ